MRTLILSIALLLGIETQAQQIMVKKIFQYPNVPTPPTTYLLVMDNGNGSLFNISLDQLKILFGTNFNNITVSNFNATFITNFTLYSTNIIVQNITNQNFITTNVTIEIPGGFTNLNLTPKTVMYADVNDAESSIPNATGVLTNDGAGGIGFSQSLSLSEIDAINFYPTNLFTGLTNAPLLSTDGYGRLTNGYPLAATNVTFIAGANLTFTTNVDGSIVIASSGTITITTVTNSTFVNTNVFISTSNSFFNLVYVTNLYSDTITNNTFVNTNTVIITGKANVNTLIVTNVSIVSGGALTNLNATASTVAYWGSDKTIGSVANASGALTNNGSGAVGYYNNFVPDARTVTIAGTANQVTSSAGAQDLSANRTWILSVPSVFTAPGTIAAVTAMTNQSLTTPGVMTNDDKGKLLSTPTLPNALLANSSITIQGSAVALGGSTLAAGSSPSFTGVNITNLSYIIQTNNGGGNALVAGSPGTATTCYITNITANTTLGAMTFWSSGISVIQLYVSCSGGTDRTLKFPANFTGAGDLYNIDLNGTGTTITNGEAKWFEIRAIPGLKTNVFQSPTK